MKKIIFTTFVLFFALPMLFSQDFTTSNLKPGQTSDPSNQSDGITATYFITHSSSQSVMAGNSVSCNAGGLHTDNSYMRVFDLVNDFGINESINVNSIDFGIEVASGVGGTQPATINIYTLSGPLTFANLTLIATESFSIADQSLSIKNVPISAIIPAGSILVVELFTPNGQGVGNSFFAGSNNLGETGPTYLAASDCGVSEPTDIGTIGFPDMMMVMNVHADPAGQVPLGLWSVILGVVLIISFIGYRYFR